MITKCISEVAYRIQLPTGTRLHDVFHIELLKKNTGNTPAGPDMLPPIRHGRACLTPQVVVRGRLARGHRESMVQWVDLDLSSASWVDLDEFQRLYLSYKLEDELRFGGGRDVTVGLTYFRQNRGAKGAEVGNRGPSI
jgi:hypothetical protein